MTRLQRILAATDLSAPARHAVERAALVSQVTAAPLDLLHVANLAPLERLRQMMEAESADLQGAVLGSAQQRLNDLATSLRQRFGVDAGTQVAAGSLLKVLAEAPAGLLVCGAKGESAVRHLLLGTTALRMLSTTTRPLLVVKQAPHEPYRRLLVPVDFSPSSLRAVKLAQEIAPSAHIVLLHAFEVPFEGHLRYASVDEDTIQHYRIVSQREASLHLESLREEAGLPTDRCTLIVEHGDPPTRIVELEQEQDCDLIVMGKHGESPFEELLLGSVTKHVLAESQGDVLVSV